MFLRRHLAVALALVSCAGGVVPRAFEQQASSGTGSSGLPSDGLRLRWLGVTTWLIEGGRTTLLHDAYFSRPLFGPRGSTESGRARLKHLLGQAGVSKVDYLLVGHSHFDHALDVGHAALTTGAVVIGSPTTCFIARGQGLPAHRCIRVVGGERLSLGDVTLRVIRTPHSSPGTLGRFWELKEVPAPPYNVLTTYRSGGAFGFLLSWGPPHPARLFIQSSLAPLSSQDGSEVDFEAALRSGFAQETGVSAWLTPVHFARDVQELGPYLDIVRPRAVIAHHFDGLFPDTRRPPPAFGPEGWLTNHLRDRGTVLIAPAVYGEPLTVPR